MSQCHGCGGVVGRDCFNPQECEWIMRDQASRYQSQPYPFPEPCQGCSLITDRTIECLGICEGLRGEADLAARAAAFAALRTVAASSGGPVAEEKP